MKNIYGYISNKFELVQKQIRTLHEVIEYQVNTYWQWHSNKILQIND